MKYDPEYNSYKFSSEELKIIIRSLEYYRSVKPDSGSIMDMINILYKSQNVFIESS